jgi:hypothetical protein
MTRVLFRLSLLPTLTFAIVSLLIHAQPYDDSELRLLLKPSDNCPLCFMGIRPGVTTVAEAILILKSHPWIESVNARFDPNLRRGGQLVIMWSGMQPSLIDTEVESALYTCGELICGLSIATKLAFGDILLAFGQPDSAIIRSIPGAPHVFIAQTATYIQRLLTILINSFCPPLFTAMALHHGLVTLQMGTAHESLTWNNINAASFQMITFQKRPYPWLLRRAFVCQL